VKCRQYGLVSHTAFSCLPSVDSEIKYRREQLVLKKVYPELKKFLKNLSRIANLMNWTKLNKNN